MTDVLPQVDTWVKVLGAAVGVFVAFLAPLSGILKEYWAYRAKIHAAPPREDTARAIPQGMIGDAVGVMAIVDALTDIAAAIREGNATAAARDKDRLAQAVEALVEQDRQPRPRR